MHGEPRAGTTADLWTFPFAQTDLTGYSVEATDGRIGKIDEATYEAGRNYLIVDTGPWIFGRKVMIPAGVVQSVDPDTETVFLRRTKDEIKNSPEWEPATGPMDEQYLNRIGDYYGRW